jgi:general secretion pathway protein B
MSLILEALKKAERQHMLGDVPRISPDSEQPSSAASHRLGWLMIILLALILVGVGVYLGSNLLSPLGQQLEPSISRVAPQPQASGQKDESIRDQPLNGGDTITATEPAVTTPPPQAGIEPRQSVTPPLPEAKEVDPTPVVEVTPTPPPAPTPAPRPLHEMPAGFVANMPSINIDIHSYAKQPAKRYVLINMEKYHEGDYLAEGPRVVEILPQGVVMEHMGEHFIHPIGNN